MADALGDDENFATTITGLVSTESTARTSADTALSGRLDVLEADPTTATAVSAEASARTSADSALSGRLDVLEADPTTQTLLTAEATSRTSADTALSGRLDTLEADPTTATAVTAAIATETAARQAADALLLPLAGGTMTGNILFGGAGGSTELLNLDFSDASQASNFTSNNGSTVVVENGYAELEKAPGGWQASGIVFDTVIGQDYTIVADFERVGSSWRRAYVEPISAWSGSSSNPNSGTQSSRYEWTVTFTATETQHVFWVGGGGTKSRLYDFVLSTEGSATTAAINVDGTAAFTGAVTGITPVSDYHLATKKYADDLVANVDLSQVETNRLAIAAETTARTTADSGLSTRLDSLEADPTTQTLLTAEATARANAITALTTGAVAQNTAAIAAEVNTDRDAAITAAIAALTAGAVAQNAADILQEVSDRQSAVAAETSARQTAVSSLQSSITVTNANVSNNAQAITTEETARVAADAGKVDKASSVNVNLVGETSAASAPVDAQGADNFLFLVVDKATGAIKSIEKSFLEAE